MCVESGLLPIANWLPQLPPAGAMFPKIPYS